MHTEKRKYLQFVFSFPFYALTTTLPDASLPCNQETASLFVIVITILALTPANIDSESTILEYLKFPKLIAIKLQQEENIQFVFCTLDILKLLKLRLARFVQKSNIVCILVTLAVLKLDIFKLVKLWQ